jgi:hypothetical protein
MQYVEYTASWGGGGFEKWLPRPYKNRGERGTKNAMFLTQVLFRDNTRLIHSASLQVVCFGECNKASHMAFDCT